jgi:hypothetical protein
MATYAINGLAECIFKFTQQSVNDFNVTFSGTPTRDFARSFTSTDVTKMYFKTYTVTSTPTSIDLTSLTDAYGQPLDFTGTIKALFIANNDATNNLTVGGGTNGLFSTLPFTLNSHHCRRHPQDSDADGFGGKHFG